MQKIWLFFLLLPTAIGLPADAYDVMRSVVKVETFDKQSQGSAVAVGPYTLVTNAHVVRGAKQVFITIFVWDKERRRIEDSFMLVAKVRVSDAVKDLALLTVPPVFRLPYAVFAVDRNTDIFDKVVAVGAGFGHDIVPFVGMILDQSWDGEKPSDKNLIQTSCEIVPGCSGGGLFKKTGGKWYLLGIMNAGFTGTEMTFAIPISRVEAFLKEKA